MEVRITFTVETTLRAHYYMTEASTMGKLTTGESDVKTLLSCLSMYLSGRCSCVVLTGIIKLIYITRNYFHWPSGSYLPRTTQTMQWTARDKTPTVAWLPTVMSVKKKLGTMRRPQSFLLVLARVLWASLPLGRCQKVKQCREGTF